jgi:hypothetical protein
MKVKPWHIGCLIVLIAAALYFLVGMREGLDNPACWGDPVDGGYRAPGTNETRFVSSTAYNSFVTKAMPRVKACFGGSFLPPGTQPTPSQMECIKNLSYPSLDEAKAACASDSSCTAILSETDSGSGSGQYQKFTEDATIVETGGARYPNMKVYVKKPCASSSPMPPGPTGTSGGASMDSKLPVPASMPPSYTLTCNASPVSGMAGSASGSDGVPPWNVSQPSPGWNSKHGYTTTGN